MEHRLLRHKQEEEEDGETKEQEGKDGQDQDNEPEAVSFTGVFSMAPSERRNHRGDGPIWPAAKRPSTGPFPS